MSSLEQLKLTFFDECSEALQQIEARLTEMRDGATDDAINAVFRAVHSVKGGAGIFGFESLVSFAHVFETTLDMMRRGDLAPSDDVVDVMLTSSDVLSDLVNMARGGTPAPDDFGADARNALQQLQGGLADDLDGGDPAPANFDGLDFTPVRIDDFEQGETPAIAYTLTLRPRAAALPADCEPLELIRALRAMGTLDLRADLAGLPPLADMTPTTAYIGWSGTFATSAARQDIDALLESAGAHYDLALLPPALVSLEPPDVRAVAPAMQSDASAFAADTPGASAEPPRQADVPSPEPSASRPAASKSGATTTRVELDRIDRVVNLVGELVISQAMLGQIVQGLPEAVSGQLWQILDEVVHHTRELKDSVMSMRAQPVGAVFQRMPRLVRELAAKTGKKVRLEMCGETTEVDRSIIERLSDPLTHIIRNSADHGIEMPAARAAAGKPEEGTIRLSADHRGSRIVIEVRDDGAGINTEKVLEKARNQGLVSHDAVLSDDDVHNLIFMPGFSTAEQISDISGRGVGMDVVRRNIQDIGGRITLKSERGKGMTLQLALPLTLAVMEGMVIKVGRETFVMPMSAIVECLRPADAEIHALVGTRGMLRLRGDLVPLVHLGDLLDVAAVPANAAERVVIIVDAGEHNRFGIVVDELCGHQQVVIKSIEESYGAVPGVAGATILGNGRVAFILDVEKLADLTDGGDALKARSRAA